MRAKTGRVAVVMLSSIGVCGCTSSPTWNHFSLWRKKPDTTAVADAPKFNPGNPALPSANQNPNNSLASASQPNAALAAAAAANPAARGNDGLRRDAGRLSKQSLSDHSVPTGEVAGDGRSTGNGLRRCAGRQCLCQWLRRWLERRRKFQVPRLATAPAVPCRAATHRVQSRRPTAVCRRIKWPPRRPTVPQPPQQRRQA